MSGHYKGTVLQDKLEHLAKIIQWNLSNSNTLGPEGVRVSEMFKL